MFEMNLYNPLTGITLLPVTFNSTLVLNIYNPLASITLLPITFNSTLVLNIYNPLASITLLPNFPNVTQRHLVLTRGQESH